MSNGSSKDRPDAGASGKHPGPRRLTLSEARHLQKGDIVVQLRRRGVNVDETLNRDFLRAKLVDIVREELATNDKGGTKDSLSVAGISDEHSTTPADPSSSDDDMSETKIFFHLNTDDWESFTERLELHFIVKNIVEAEMKRATLLTRCDEDTYKLFRNLCAPDKPASKTYDELIKLLSEHLKPAPSEVMERCTFNRAKQELNETVTEYVARLRQLSRNCNFPDLNNALRDQLVCGIRDDATRVELFQLSNLTFETALKDATARESATKNAAEAIQRSQTRVTNKKIWQ